MSINTSALPSVDDEVEGTQLMLHHLQIAATYFEVTHDDNGEFAKAQILKLAPVAQPAMMAFVDALVAAYEAMDAF